MQERKFSYRAFATLSVALTGLGLPITGVLNHVYGFGPMTQARHAWMSAHNVLGLLFIVFALVHIALNRRALFSYARQAARRLPGPSREAIAALAMVTALLVLSVGHALLADGSDAEGGGHQAIHRVPHRGL